MRLFKRPLGIQKPCSHKWFKIFFRLYKLKKKSKSIFNQILFWNLNFFFITAYIQSSLISFNLKASFITLIKPIFSKLSKYIREEKYSCKFYLYIPFFYLWLPIWIKVFFQKKQKNSFVRYFWKILNLCQFKCI